ncbi:GrpB family protein [Sporolituus thermophilus]|uniref:GrpB domain, predicted nucleotidyltransferase, UPF0157 family n=1 Tax=Sporolituus thermophilus DSM 23256 TaxID=1123285 RepID=A0A1G7P0L4_9FIRM|nr:GrpB family protein [Sporolituus thermophilus]SDF79657.1 GrpB domain, predicted nucleotidyltransferase, UPF0157 family [Sporolituus thermophilus DSM 23256]
MKLGLHYKKVSIVPYDPDWVLYYKQEQTLLQQVLGYLCKDIQHVGSTAVEGMPSKPIIDIAIALVDISYLDEAIDILAQLGYFYLGEGRAKGKYFFVKGPKENTTHHVHVTAWGSVAWREILLFRDFLRKEPAKAQEYARLKQRLAEEYADDRDGYAAAKSEWIRSQGF